MLNIHEYPSFTDENTPIKNNLNGMSAHHSAKPPQS